jgi:hypothetical protein
VKQHTRLQCRCHQVPGVITHINDAVCVTFVVLRVTMQKCVQMLTLLQALCLCQELKHSIEVDADVSAANVCKTRATERQTYLDGVWLLGVRACMHVVHSYACVCVHVCACVCGWVCTLTSTCTPSCQHAVGATSSLLHNCSPH